MKQYETKSEYHMSQEELNQLQNVQKDLILEVKRICEKNNIRYNMVGGTMLGAIRHGGYIPWDDDADIGFLRSEYEKFLAACETDLNHDKYYVQDSRKDKGYRWGYGKLRRKGTEFVRLGQEHMPYDQCISIDLMPFDNVPDNPVIRRIHFFECFCFRKLFWSSVGKKTEKSSILRIWYSMLGSIPEKIVYGSFQKFICRSNKKGSSLVRILTFPTPKGCFGYDKKWYMDLSLYEFEEYKLPGATDYDGYLKTKYGDYMKLPPVEKRKVHAISKLVLPRE